MAGVDELERGRELYARRAWSDAYDSLTRADELAPLAPDALELLARSAYMLGRDDDYLSGLERAHHAYLDSGEALRAVRCAFWIGHNLLFRGEAGPAGGWFARAKRLLDREQQASVEDGYLLIAVLLQHLFSGDAAAAYDSATEIAAIGERFGDEDLIAIGLMEQGHALVRQGDTENGLRLVDETMVAVTAGELSPIVAGIVYCNTIGFCQGVYELRRAREWTSALTRWCEQQPRRRPLPVLRRPGQVGLACAALGDNDTAALELEAARDAFERLGARPDLARLDSLIGRAEPSETYGLTERELQVLRLVAAGKSNREIAAELFISDHTARRHLQNIFRKLGVSSRAAATAFGFQRGLI